MTQPRRINVRPKNSANAPVIDNDKDTIHGTEIGSRGGAFTWTNGTGLYNGPEEYGRIPIDNLVEMRRVDGQARALMRLLTLPIVAALKESEWILPEDVDVDDSAEEVIKFCNDMWNLPPYRGGMTTPKTKLLKETLLALSDGVSVFEECRQIPGDGPLKGKLVLQKLAYRDPRTVTFLSDENGGFDGIKQKVFKNGFYDDVEIPKNKVIYYAVNEEESPRIGVSYFEPAYMHYDLKRKLYYIAHIAAQLAAVPGRVGEMGPGATPTRIRNFQQALSQFGFNSSITIPNGWKVTPFNSNTSFPFLELIDHHNMMMAASVLAKFMQSEDRQVLIDNGKGDASSDMFVMQLETIMAEIAEIWSNYLMPKYVDWNFPGVKIYPVFRFGQISDSTRDTLKALFTTLATAGSVNSNPEFLEAIEEKLAKRLGLEIDYKAIEERKEIQRMAETVQQANDAIAGAEQQSQTTDNTGNTDATTQNIEQNRVAEMSQADLETLFELATQAAALLKERPDFDQIAPIDSF